MSLSDSIAVKTFTTKDRPEEFFITIAGMPCASFEQELDRVAKCYTSVLEQFRLKQNTLVFSRIFLSDLLNQDAVYAASNLSKQLISGFVSKIEQRPLHGNRVSLFAYHIKGKSSECKKSVARPLNSIGPQTCIVSGNTYRMIWFSEFGGSQSMDSCHQAWEQFSGIDPALHASHVTFRENAVRTWIYARDIDTRYNGIVDGRNRYFETIGLSNQTRYVVSTGIEGKTACSNTVVCIETLLFAGIHENQIVRMEALDAMCPTIHYGVAFERGLRIRFGDRSHLYISGTASIDKHGNVLYLGDPYKQTERTIDNIAALLERQDAGLQDLMYLLVYLRDPSNLPQVQTVVAKRIGNDIPVLFLEAAVCRPAWLVEIEGLAIIRDSACFPNFM